MRYPIFLLLIIFIISISCNNNNSSKTNKCPNASINLTVNGDAVKLDDLEGSYSTVNDSTTGEEGQQISVALDLKQKGRFSFDINNWPFQNPPQNGVVEKRYFPPLGIFNSISDTTDQTNTCKEMQQNYFLCDGTTVTFKNSQGVGFTSYSEDTSQYIIITKCNPNQQKISGDVKLEMIGLTGNLDRDTVKIQGSFSDICYELP